MIHRAAFLLPFLAAVPALAAERRYSVTDFDRVRIEGPYQVTLVTGATTRARAIGDQSALDRVTIEVQSGVLKIHPNRSAWGGTPGVGSGPVTVELATRALRGATVVGSGRLAIDRLRGLKADLSLSGSGAMTIDAVESDALVLTLAGAGTLKLAGKAKQLRATVQGSGTLDGEGLAADDATLVSDSSGSIAFRAGRTARVSANGLGEVRIAGPASCTVTGPGAASVTCGK